MKITEAILSYILKKGVIGESHNVNVDVNIPNGDSNIKINVKADNVIVKVQKDEW